MTPQSEISLELILSREEFPAYVIYYMLVKKYVGEEFSEIHVNMKHYVGEIC